MKKNFSNKEMRAEVGRELSRRRRVYPRMVDWKLMSKADANRRIAIMQSLADDLRKIPSDS
ncbi:MAG: hypothetical protein JJ894_03270 [Dinoroseobacter sp.]|nr:hypothetical protein [Dinoroseobacter sp.]